MRKFSIGYLLTVVGLFFYSFTQIDLGLTLSQVSIWQTAEKLFKNIGYFQRPFSTFLFASIVFLLFTFYLLILNALHKKEISKRLIWFLIITTAIILTFSYNAFSYDLFNYMFDAKIVTYYNQNPYIHKALDFPGDPMLSFMHWTHRSYPYGPTWLGLTVPLSLGIEFFLPTFFLFKALMSVSFLGTAFFIGKILRKFSSKNELFGVAFFALNPLVIIESLVSSHNDIVMMFFVILALYLLMSKKYVRSTMLFVLSIGVKFATVFVLPVYLLILYFQKNKKAINWEFLFVVMTVIMVIPVILASYRTNFQPWYLLNILPFAALISKKHYILIPSVVMSLFAAFEYLPFLYLGNWDNPVPSILSWMITASLVLSLLLTIAWRLKKMIK
ncbi:MAG: glycosyltransferase 87 family protein [Candidatus Parcubacteria bacterium]|nr:glycosyltransferase 87 family protein [Candidatus Parcubacteria bacterium]